MYDLEIINRIQDTKPTKYTTKGIIQSTWNNRGNLLNKF